MLCSTCCSIFHGRAPRLDERTSHPFSLEKFQSSLALECFICCGLRDNFRIDTEAYEIDSIDHLIGIRAVEYKFEIMGLMNDRIRTSDHSKYRYLTVTWDCEVEYPGRERQIRQLVQWPIQSVEADQKPGDSKWNEPSVLAAPKITVGDWLSDEIVSKVSRWLKLCRQGHDICSSPRSALQKKQWYPSRLIAVQTGSVRLIETIETTLTGPYLTLSHRWPADASVYTQLKQDNLSSLKKGVEVTCLSRVFQDAIVITRRLGVDYIWIDSLCIIQDSKEDWEAESATMADIYSQSYCNLSATADRCQDEGLFHPRHQLQFSHERVTSDWIGDPFKTDDGKLSQCRAPSFHRQDYVLYDPNFWTRRVDQQELFTRGWVFQEQQLGPRILHFSSDQLLWECRQHRACEMFPSGLPQKEMGWGEIWRSSPAATVIKGALASVRTGVDGSGFYPTLGLSPWLAWQQVIGHYTRLNLTNAQDALVALGGVARVYQQLYKSKYVAGHWEEDFVSSLIWRISTEGHCQNCPSARVQRPEPFRTKVSPYIAPSWSWASADMGVVGYGARLVPTYTPDIVHKCVLSSSRNPFGTVTDGYLLLKGPIYPASLAVNDRFNFKVLVGLLVEGFASPVWTVDLDMCCRRHPNLTEVLEEMEDDEDSEAGSIDNEASGEDTETDEDSAEQSDGGSEDDFDPDWDLETLSRRYPVVFYLPIFEGTSVDESDNLTEIRTGLVLEPVDGYRGAYRRVGICFDKDISNRDWRLPQATGISDSMESGRSSRLYLDLGQGMILMV
ncbi:heterokaryon incompatibility protein-domain-containing protein [Triangularia verruculosa]|uniref:Heterokaryon incompatibility protein-domain-containing protein n=1 Tax=Triangularia verruculosa TaxID=2587418 RepID=A0AAN7ASY4_9PEZI|nr:heterokaryon incompatibility protein-domain-containing protein [Triangularia verruculosa]